MKFQTGGCLGRLYAETSNQLCEAGKMQAIYNSEIKMMFTAENPEEEPEG